MASDHNSVINAEARKVLKPLGLTRQGKSRLWYDDHGWWRIKVEFQPSAWSKGSYLNVGINLLLYEGSADVFHIGHRVDVPFIDADASDDFAQDAHALALRAKEAVEELRAQFASLESAVSFYRDGNGAWTNFNLGILLGLQGDVTGARAAFDAMAALPKDRDFIKAKAQRVAELHKLVSDRTAFIDTMRGIVLRTRAIGHLPDWHEDIVFS